MENASTEAAKTDEEWLAYESEHPDTWKTAVGWGVPGEKVVAGYPLVELTGNISYGQALHLVLRQELPDERTTRMLDVCLTALIDHGFRNTVAVTARLAASANPDPIAAICAGVLGIGRHTAGAQRYVVELILEGMAMRVARGSSLDEVAEVLVHGALKRGAILPGLGTKMHKALGHDVRAVRIRELAEELGFTRDERFLLYMAVHRAFEREKGHPVVMNVDGMMGAILAAMGFEPVEVAALEVAIMLPSIMGHAVEEIRSGNPMRNLPQAHLEYVGPPRRSLAAKWSS